jgi:hypothetical protein
MSSEPITTQPIAAQPIAADPAMAAEKGLLIAVLIMVLLGVGAMLLMQ